MDAASTDEHRQMTNPACLPFPEDGHILHNFRHRNCTKSGFNESKRTLLYLFTVFVVILTQNSAHGFNLDVKFPTFVTIPEKNSYFGFSVDMFADEDESWLLVGAPKSRSRGEVYKCKYEEKRSNNCTRIDIVKDNAATSAMKDMFGFTLKSGPIGKQLLACAPYFTQQTKKRVKGEMVTYYDMLGVCYFMDDFTTTSTNVFKLIPCQGEKGVYHDGDAHGTCEIGLSASVAKDGNHLILGAAGSFYRQGSIMLIPLPITSDITKLPIHIGEIKPDIPPGWNKKFYLQQSYDENYFGYAVATGKSIGNSQLIFAGAPRRFGYDLLGMVVVYDDSMNAALLNFTGNQTGEYFGSALAAADLNNDGLDDLIIGAPLYSNPDRRLYENGRIYVYYQLQASRDPVEDLLILDFTEPILISGNVGRARFGHVITAIGDINQDGYEDIAVGAPYTVNDAESGKNDGSVFIFNGGPEGLVLPASQEIKGMKLDDSLAAFGYSISGNKDLDRNGYPDIVTGAYLSDQAVLIRARPVVQIASRVRVQPETVDIETKSCNVEKSATTCFEIATCFSYSGKNLPPSILLEYTYDVDSTKTGDEKRAFVLDDSPRNITLIRKSSTESEDHCVNEWAYFEIDVRDKLSEIKVEVSHSLIERNQPVEPVLNQLAPSNASAIVDIFKDCGDDDICQAELKVQSDLDQAVVYVGTDWPIVLQEVVSNLGEPAFLTMLVVEFPKEVYYVGTQDKSTTSGISPLCTNVDQFVTCEIGNPMKRDTAVNVNLKFQTLQLDGNIPSLTFKSFVNSTNPTNNTSQITAAPLKVDVKSEIIIYNSSSPDALILKDTDREEKSDLKGNLTSVIHTYEVINKGPSEFSSASINIQWPLKTNDGLYLLELVQIVEDHTSVSCAAVKTRTKRETEKPSNSSDTANYYYCDGRAECVSINCSVNGPLNEVSIAIHFLLPLSTVLQNDLNSYIRSDFQFKIDGYPYAISTGDGPLISSKITTEFLYKQEPERKEVQWWIIAIAVAAGVLFLLLIIFILWRCGFFERKKRPDKTEDQSQKPMLNPNGGDDDVEEMEQYLK